MIAKLAAGLAAGYVLGARAGREKYDQIVAVARKLSDRRIDAPVLEATQPLDSESAATVPDTALPAVPPVGLAPSDKPRRPRSRRTNSGPHPTTAGNTNETRTYPQVATRTSHVSN